VSRKFLKFRDKRPYSFFTICIYYDVLHIVLENNVESGTIHCRVKRARAPRGRPMRPTGWFNDSKNKIYKWSTKRVILLKKKPDPRPLGVPLDDLERAINQTNLKASRNHNSLIVRNTNLVTRVDVVPPANRECGDATIKAVVQIKTELPKEIAAIFLESPQLAGTIDAMATLGALTIEGDRYFIGSRLTIYEQENAWNVHFGLLLFSVIGAADSFLGSLRTAFSGEEVLKGTSAWTEQDLSLVESHLSRICVCTIGGLRLTAEFSLKSGEVTALYGHNNTALWRIFADQPHPALGGGLFCLLELPHRIVDESRIETVLNQLNQMEIAPRDLPPHFGSWCRGNLGNNPAYVAFFPNVMHAVEGIALNASIWALHRAEWANATLHSLGVHL
jgi:hypothetical protein